MINIDNGFDLNCRWDFPGLRKHAFAFISLFVLILLIYGNSFQGVWQFDDYDNIINNPQIHLKSLSWLEIKTAFFASPSDILSRSLTKLSFALNYYVGGLNVFGYHLVNIVIHLTASIFLYLLVHLTLNLPLLREKYSKSSYSIALLAAFLWASSPVNVNAVTYIVQRMTSMAGMAYIMSLFYYVKGRTSSDPFRRIAFSLLGVIAGGMAIGAKQNAIMLPIAIFLYDLFLIQGVTGESIRKNRPIIFLILVTAIAGLVYVIFFTSMLDYQYWTFSMKERLLTAPRILLFYISLLIWPLGPRLTMDHDIQISKSLLDPWTTLPAIMIIVLAICYALWIARRKPLLSFCILFFFLNHLIEGTIIPIDLIYEHRNYVPAMFLFVPVAIMVITVLDYFAYKKSMQLLMFFFMIFVLVVQGHTVFMRNDIFKSQEVFWRDNIRKCPDLSRPHGSLGYIYAMQGDYRRAIMETTVALQSSRYHNIKARILDHVNLANIYFLSGMNDEMALFHYNEALRIDPKIAARWVYDGGLSLIMMDRDLKLAHEYGYRGIVNAPQNQVSHNNFALILLKEGDLDGAIKEAGRAIELQSNYSIPLATLGEAYRRKRDYAKSEYYWTEFVRKEPDNITAHLALIELYHRQGMKDKLITIIGKILSLSPEGNIYGMIKKDRNKFFPYTPDPKTLVPILQSVNIDGVPYSRIPRIIRQSQ
jgi:tetratricopeptide (TPR) repeat protein